MEGGHRVEPPRRIAERQEICMSAILGRRRRFVRCIIMPMFHRVARLMLEVLAVLALVVVAGVALMAWRFSQGPVSVGFLKPLLDSAVEEAVPGYQVELADTVLVWAGWDHGVDVRARDMKILGPRGGRVAEFDEATIRLSGRALIRGQIAPASITVNATS
jgi:hypothetical protein